VADDSRAIGGKEASAVRRGDQPTRKELEAQARKLNIRGRSKMGKSERKRAVARARCRATRRRGPEPWLRRFDVKPVLGGSEP